MRRAAKQIHDESTMISVLDAVHVGHLGTVAPDGFPMVKPLNFAYRDRRIYFHSAREGEKIDHILHDSRVCFEAAQPIAYIKGIVTDPCKAEYLYRSVIIRGRARVVEDREEQLTGLSTLMEKYQPEGGYGDFLQWKLDITAVVCIEIEEMIGKEDLGKGQLREIALRLLADGVALPVILEHTGE